MQKTCIVVPCYNEEHRLDLPAFQAFLDMDVHSDLLFSNDGSTDKTAQVIQDFQSKNPGRVWVHTMLVNAGKAEAVRCGMNIAFENQNYELVGFWDADLSTPLSEVPRFRQFLVEQSKQIVLGSRMKRLGATVNRKRSRHFLGRVFSTMASIILQLPVYDSQCGAKLFTKKQRPIFSEKFKTKWLFDVELLARYRNLNGKNDTLGNIAEIPVSAWVEKGGSKLKFTYMLKVPFELLTIHRAYN